MLTTQNVYVILYSLPIYQILYFTVQLLTFKRSATLSKRFLGLLFLVMTFLLIMNAIYRLNYLGTFSYFYYIFLPIILAVFPIFFLYLSALIKENGNKSGRTIFILFVPPILLFLLICSTFGPLSFEQKQIFINSGFSASGHAEKIFIYSEIVYWFGVALVLFQLVYFISSISRIIKTEEAAIEERPGHLPYLQIKWIIIITVSVGIFVLSNFAFNIFFHDTSIIPALLYNVIILASCALPGIYGMRQEDLIEQVIKLPSQPEVVAATDSTDVIYHEIPLDGVNFPELLSRQESDQLIKSLEELMTRNKPYLNSRLSMAGLAAMLKTNRRKLSYVINMIMQKNFYAYINEYRIKEAEVLLLKSESEAIKLEALGAKVGFRSKSSFNACFKKYTGQTPSEFRGSGRGRGLT